MLQNLSSAAVVIAALMVKYKISNVKQYSKTCLKQPLKRRPKIGFQDRLSLNAGQKFCRMLQESILQYFRPALSYNRTLRHLFFPIFEWPLTSGLTVYFFLLDL